MMLLRANVLALGFSGIRLEVIELLTEMLNRGVLRSCRRKDRWERAAISRRSRISR